ncbi:MAG: LL-diaminopimelate aminotransferase [Candidatus Melainabacteria bacterium RIFOXYA12_FULL_32_12]|nr:MAG: LL-diaminopimelate aminotransferase [Candidatus Melainabacteria bacterium RIFOXYA2_FULL_32_9]OGI29230.1 MAG: LL-diaminopimelate aminotransferase [Candidatus Melainabacteria bacterium RIFOXYA12_FULL_32_12]
MRLSKRLDRIPSYLFAEIDKKVDAAKAKGYDIINLGVGDPDTPTFPHIVEEMHTAIDDPSTHNYPPYQGTSGFRTACAEWMKQRFDVNLNPDNEILALIGSKEGIAHVFFAFVDPGDYTLVPDPAYPVYRNATILAGGTPYFMPINPQNNYLPELDKIPEDIAKQSKLIFLNYPNNPTGAVANLEYFKEVVDFAKKYDILICHDQAYCEMTFDGYVAPSFLQVEGAKERCIEFFSHSKTYNMTGWRIGWAAGGAEPMNALGIIKNNIDSGIFKAIQKAGINALGSPQSEIDQLNTLYQKRRDIMIEGLKELGWNIEPSKATFYLWIPTPKGMSSVDFSELMLEKAHIIVPPGNGWGESGEGFFRIALTVGEEKLKEVIQRMKKAGIRYQ